MVAATSRWLGVRADVLCSLFITSIALVAVLVCENPGMNLWNPEKFLPLKIKIKSFKPNSAETQVKYKLRIRFYSIVLTAFETWRSKGKSIGLQVERFDPKLCRGHHVGMNEENYILSLRCSYSKYSSRNYRWTNTPCGGREVAVGTGDVNTCDSFAISRAVGYRKIYRRLHTTLLFILTCAQSARGVFWEGTKFIASFPRTLFVPSYII